MKAAVELQPEESLYLFIEGLLHLKAKAFNKACASFDKAIEAGHPHPERMAAFYLWRGRSLELSGDRTAGLNDYKKVLELESDENVRKAAQRAIKKKYKASKLKSIDIDFTFADVVTP